MEESACLLCHCVIRTHVPLDCTIIRKIRITLPNINLNLFLDDAVICEDCSLSLENYSKTISDWSRIEHEIITSVGRSNNINLKEICLNDHCQEENTRKICRLCLILVSSFVALTEEKAKMWEKCLSTLDLKLTTDPVLCGSCYETLIAYYQFIVMCTTKKETLKIYLQEHQSSNENFVNIIKHMNNTWSLSDLRIESVVTLDQTETFSRYNTRKRKIVIQNDTDDEDNFDVNDDEDRDPDFTIEETDSNIPPLSWCKQGNKRRVLKRVRHAPRKDLVLCKYCNEKFVSDLMQLHHYQCERIPLKHRGGLWTCVYCSLEDTDWDRLEKHLKNCDKYQTALQRKQLENQKKTLLEALLTPSHNENENLPMVTDNSNTSRQDSLPTVETLSINNNNNNSGIKNVRDDSDINADTNKATEKVINIISNVQLSPEIGPKKTTKFSETSQCLILKKCVNCKFNTRCGDKMYKHVLEHMSLECPECGLRIKEKTSMYRHLTDCHLRDFTRNYYWCVRCVELFRARRSANAHKCISTKKKVLFKSNTMIFCMLCKYESEDVIEASDHQMMCLKNLDKNEIDQEIIEID